ncbi:GCN5 family acetyltransferase [Gallibacterium genomosp. 3]|uniref:GCN5 family acetyltransferase n=1 Tax=Gallibacterium genomosp. 3 TaxID=505345 RepID=A0A1A7NT57_9PAST|nr:GNAT family N-acetyltransferase [Gallibacterium genomosp. 3]OBW92785.1 GCN5 family acetyltransferase [Gallibacterium genomosp. 3]
MIIYRTDTQLTAQQYIELLKQTTLGARRPIDDIDKISKMLQHADLLITAWYGEHLVGAARAVTDFAYCCYLSDLAVSEKWQKQGIGKQLIQTLKEQLDAECKIILLSAPQAINYYPHIGFTQHPSAWVK